jgi:hypothetical protein
MEINIDQPEYERFIGRPPAVTTVTERFLIHNFMEDKTLVYRCCPRPA